MRMTNEISQSEIGNIYYYIYCKCSRLFTYRNRYARTNNDIITS